MYEKIFGKVTGTLLAIPSAGNPFFHEALTLFCIVCAWHPSQNIHIPILCLQLMFVSLGREHIATERDMNWYTGWPLSGGHLEPLCHFKLTRDLLRVRGDYICQQEVTRDEVDYPNKGSHTAYWICKINYYLVQTKQACPPFNFQLVWRHIKDSVNEKIYREDGSLYSITYNCVCLCNQETRVSFHS